MLPLCKVIKGAAVTQAGAASILFLTPKLRKEYFNSHPKWYLCFILSLDLKCNHFCFKSFLLPNPIGMGYTKTVYSTKNLM